ncbi:DUF5677 domain-containing protein [Pedobacter cryoconitis]|uniref:Uncharacterized protein n=1 Tax=Pedobacter cryoconitis TaxID=188932 RepID=A0A327RVN5_9SPHI|nr:DUF5677 domain-containing protein [Pedobacter cryoconitis]RAJ19814.1 hypothetical protein LY11_05278 [Pedobacter cryoconitis]
MPTIFAPTENIITICNLIDQGITDFLESLNNEHFGKYEFEIECLLNIVHSIRILESIIELARKDLVYIQSALILTRSLFETLIKVSWILHPPDVFDNESRYIAQLSTECEFWDRWIKELKKKSNSSTEKEENIRLSMNNFKNDLSKLLVEKGYGIPKLPNMREMLKSLEQERKYINYLLLSQYTHMSHVAGKIYRQNLGAKKELSENVNLEDWYYVFAICWPVFELATELYVFRTENRENLYKNEFKETINKSLVDLNIADN